MPVVLWIKRSTQEVPIVILLFTIFFQWFPTLGLETKPSSYFPWTKIQKLGDTTYKLLVTTHMELVSKFKNCLRAPWSFRNRTWIGREEIPFWTWKSKNFRVAGMFQTPTQGHVKALLSDFLQATWEPEGAHVLWSSPCLPPHPQRPLLPQHPFLTKDFYVKKEIV